MNEALADIKVADMTHAAIGPCLGRFLGDLGATVIHIESESHADIVRFTPPYQGEMGWNTSTYFGNYSCNKYGITLNLRHRHAPQLIKRVLDWADIIIENFRPGALDRLKISLEELAKPSSIIVHISNQGHTGRYSRHPGFANNAASLSGLDELTGESGGPALPTYGAPMDIVSAWMAATATLAALDYRDRTGKGQSLDLSMLDAGVQFVAPLVLQYVANQEQTTRAGNRCSYAAPHGAFPCRGEERWCAIAVFNDSEWRSLCEVMGTPQLAEDPRFATLLARKKNETELEAVIATWTRNYSPEELMRRLQQAGVAAGVLENGQDLTDDPQLRHRQHLWTFNHPVMGEYVCDAPPFLLSRTNPRGKMPAPCLGEHNHYIYTQVLGMSEEEFVELLNDGALK